MRNNNAANIKKLNEVYEGIGNIEVPQKFENNNIYQTSFNNKAVADATSAMCKLKDYMYFSS